MKRPLLMAVAVLTAASLACSFNINLPRLKTGPTETLTVNEALPSGDTVTDVEFNMGAGTFKLASGAEGLAEGAIKYNVAEWKPKITNSDGKLTIEQGQISDMSGIPVKDVVNDWDLKLGDTPINLTIHAGAYQGNMDLSGLRLRNLDISDGASDSEVTFDSANPEEMDKLSYKTGASKVRLAGLANANFETMTFDGGAGDYTLDFSGELQRDATVKITSGVSSMRIVIPSEIEAEVVVSGGVNNVKTEGTWTTSGDTYKTTGTGNALTINVDIGVGSLTLVSK